nr:MAG TPA: hypothetical protein [Caudoviricetes sp.]
MCFLYGRKETNNEIWDPTIARRSVFFYYNFY